MSYRIWLTIGLGVSISSACGGGGAPLAPSVAHTGTLTGSTVSAIDEQPVGGVTVQIGSQKVVSDAAGAFHLDNPPAGSQPVIFSAPSVVERRTTLMMPADGPVREELIPASFDLQAFDQMFRGTGRMQRWTSPPSLVVLTTVMNYSKEFGDGHQYHATSEQMSD